MSTLIKSGIFLLSSILMIGSLNGALVNSGFENEFNDWTATGDGYILTDDGFTRTRSSLQSPAGSAFADVWFSGSPSEGTRYAVFGSDGNESVGSMTSALWTAEYQTLSFDHAGNNSNAVPQNQQAFAAILDAGGSELARVYANSFNDSVWRTFSFDLQAIGLSAGDQFRFYYEDAFSWSIVDNISESGPALASAAVPEPSTYALMLLGLVGLGAYRRKIKK